MLASCKLPEIPAGDTAEPPDQGVVLGVRTASGEPFFQARAFLGGGSAADPDAAGFVYYVNVSPGRTQVFVRHPGFATAQGAPYVQPEALSVASLVMLPLEPVAMADPTAPLTFDGDGIDIDFVGGGFLLSDVAVTEPLSVGAAAIDATARAAIPGDLLGLRSDDTVGPIALDHVFAARVWSADDLDPILDADHRATVTVTLPADSPVWSEVETRLWTWSSNRTYWVESGGPTLDPIARTATFSASSFGWWGLGRDAPARGCMVGTLVDALGMGLQGAEVRYFQDGTVGVDRASTDSGAFCLPIDPGLTGVLRITGVEAARTHLYTAEFPVTGPVGVGSCGTSACSDLGVLTVQSWPDADGDRAWTGPGGDCNDSDASINPNPTLGDGSWCGGAL